MNRSSHSGLLVVAALALVLSGCGCALPPKVQDDGGAMGFDAGFDAGLPDTDAGTPGEDAGVDAGPPPQLRIRKVLPPRGGSAGGTTVLLEGSGFIRDFATRGTDAKRVTSLKLGSNSVIEYTIIDDETIELRSPPGVAGPASVSIKNPLGTFLCNSCFTYFDELFVTQLSPKEGPLKGGNEVTIVGQGFTNDTQVVFGTFATPQLTFVDDKTLKAVVPRGLMADAVDVIVYNKNGVASQRRAYRYLSDVKVNGMNPHAGPVAGGTTVVLAGAGFMGATAVQFGAHAATSFTVNDDTQITAVTPAATAAGAVDVTVTTPHGSWTVKGGFAYVVPGGAFDIFSVVPHVARPGETVTLTGQALDGAGITVSVGGNAALVGAKTFSTLQFTVPARGAAPRKADVVVTAGVAKTLAQGFTYGLTVSGITPPNGPVAGGTPFTVSGGALPSTADVFLGSLPATGVVVPGESSLSGVTPKGAGGAPSALWVRDSADFENEAVLANAFTFNEGLALGRVQPERGAIAGGTLVTVLGAGFGESTVVSFGANKAKDVKIIDSHTLSCRTPKGDVGTVDVNVERLGAKDDLPGGFSYFDPRSISGGLSGGPLVGTLNITVLDASPNSYGAPIPQATVMLGVDTSTPYQGLTDTHGQMTFSDASLVKAQTVTVYKENFAAATVTSVGAENLTVFIARTGGGGGPPSSGTPPAGVPASVISGRVTGFKAPRPLVNDEALEARVFVTQNSFFAGPPFSGPPNKSREKWVITQDGAEYVVYTNAGLHATYAVMGITNKLTQQFTPYLMGVCRGITTSPDNPATNQDIVLDMHLDLTVPITIDSPITVPSGVVGMPPGPAMNAVYAWLDLGAEGFIPNPNNWATGTAAASTVVSTSATLSFPHFPRLDGSNFIFLNHASNGLGQPSSYYFRRQPGDMSTGVTVGPMLPVLQFTQPQMGIFNGTLSWTVAPGPVPQLHSVEIVKPTPFGSQTLWSVVLPGDETQVVLPAPAVQQLRDEQAGQSLFVGVYSSLSPKFAYNQWTYDTLNGVNWSAFTSAVSEPFSP